MPWKECNRMEERLRFVARLLDGEKMAPLCREFGISRKTGYKLFNRYKNEGLAGLEDQSKRPYRHANKLPFQIERAILKIKKEHTSWGAPKIREKLIRLYPMIRPPARVRSMPCLIDTAWSHAENGVIQRLRAPRYVTANPPMDSGVPISRANSC